MQLKGFYLCHNRRGFCCFGLQLPAALWPKKFHTHEIYWAAIRKAFPHIFSMKAFLKYKLSHKRLFGFMKHAVLGKKKKGKRKHKAKPPLKLGSSWSFNVLYTFHVHLFKVLKFSKIFTLVLFPLNKICAFCTLRILEISRNMESLQYS